jgi:diguanylate cyclase (GGDEF)-like protein
MRWDTFSDRAFYALIWATIALCVLEAASFCVDGRHFPLARPLNILLNVLLFSLNIIFAYIWTLYVDFKLFEDMEHLRRRARVLVIPAAAIFLLAVASAFSPLLFAVSADNVYSRTQWTPLPFLVSFFYLFYAEYQIYSRRNSTRSYLFLPSILFLVPVLIGSTLQLLFYGLSLTWASLSISVVSIYINVQGEFSSVDALSGLYTRQYLHQAVHRRTLRPPEGGHLAGIMIDLDRFKSINDTYGHVAGDDAIRAVGRLLRSCAGPEDLAVRYGGDEFILLSAVAGEADTDALIRRIEAGVAAFNAAGTAPYALSLSIGRSSFDPEQDSFDALVRRMDAALYAEKRRKSGILPERRQSAGRERE